MSHARQNHFAIAVLVLCGTVLAGCGEGLPQTTPVRGRVLWRGVPLPAGDVTFHARDSQAPQRPATGMLGADGTFELTSYRAADGVPPGEYRVTVHSYLREPGVSDSGEVTSDYVWRIPPRYGDPAQSGLTANVPPRGALELEFLLVD